MSVQPSDNVRELPRPAPTPDLSDLSDELAGATRLGIGGRARLRALAVATGAPFWVAWLIRKSPVWLWYACRDLLVGLVRVLVASFMWLHMADERRAIAQMENRDAKARAKAAVNKDNRFRLIVVGVVAVLALVGHLILWFSPYSSALAAEALAAVALLEWIGHQPNTKEDPVRRRGPLTHGTSSRTLRRDMEEAFAAKKIPEVGVIGLTLNRYGWHGVIETEEDLTDKLIEHVERWVHAPPGSLMTSTDPRNAAAHPFKLLIEDPLAVIVQPSEPVRGLDIRQPAALGRHLFGTPLRLNLMTHIGLVGRQRSGKSSALWAIIDHISRCSNAKIIGSADPTGGPAFKVWRGVIPIRASEPAEIHYLLDMAIAETKRRTTLLGARAESDDDDITDNWQPTAADPAWYLPFDELHAIADDREIMGKIAWLARTSAKACVYLVLSTQRAGKDDFGLTALRANINLKVMFSCEAGDITMMVGGGMIEAGWRPNRLKPAQGDVPYDAGKAYVWDGDHQQPEVVRFARLGIADCRERARALIGQQAPGSREPGPEPSEEQQALAVLEAAFEHYGHDRIPSRWLGEYLTERDDGWTLDRLRAALRLQGVTTTPIGPGPWPGKNPQGYKRSAS